MPDAQEKFKTSFFFFSITVNGIWKGSMFPEGNIDCAWCKRG